jgi:hypothetical protein
MKRRRNKGEVVTDEETIYKNKGDKCRTCQDLVQKKYLSVPCEIYEGDLASDALIKERLRSRF